MINRKINRGYLSLDPLVDWIGEKRPLEWSRIFGGAGEITLEIGFGLGDFLVAQARENPKRNFVGVETGWLPVKRTLRKIALAGVSNVRIVRVDAWAALERLFSPGSIRAVNGLFPCPWPKNRHAKNRLFSRDFLLLLNSRLVTGGEVLIVTDDHDFFQWLLAELPQGLFEVFPCMTVAHYSTKYEKKWCAEGQECFHELRLVKLAHLDRAVKEDIPLITYRVRHFNPATFHPLRQYGAPAVEFKEFIFDPLREKGMVRCLVAEGNFVQNFWLDIVKEDGLWHIRPAKGCGIVPTMGIQKALDVVYGAALAEAAERPLSKAS